GAFQVFVNAYGDVADDRIVDAHAAFNLGDLRTRAFDRQHDEVAFVEFADGISETAAAHAINFCDLRALIGNNVTELRDERFNVALFGVRGDDEQNFINSHMRESSLWISLCSAPKAKQSLSPALAAQSKEIHDRTSWQRTSGSHT